MGTISNELLQAEIDSLRQQLSAATTTSDPRFLPTTYHDQLIRSMVNFAIIGTDLNGHILQWNSGAEHVLGWSAEEMRGSVVDRIFTPEDQKEHRAQVEMRLACEKGIAGDHRWHVKKDGSKFWASGEMTPVQDTDGKHCGYLKVLQDRSDAHLSSEALRIAEKNLLDLNSTLEQTVETRTRNLMQAEAQLRQSQKMEAVGQLTGGIAHDFNNLLTGITGSLEMMQSRISQGRMGELDKYLSAAQGASRRAAALTHRLLAFSRRQTLDPKPVDVYALVAEMQDLIIRTVGPSIHVETAVEAEVWPTYADRNQLENALLNLCINARDAMPHGGRLSVQATNRILDSRSATSFNLSPGSYVCLSVSDTGTGMSAEVAERAFEPFFTTKPLGMGTGLGLSMIYGFTRQSKGQVKIYSEMGHGSTISVFLPRHLGAAVEIKPRAIDQMPRALEGETVLVVDDEPTVRMLVTEILEDLGYRAIEAADGASGLMILESNVRVDLLVSDVGLPGNMNGRQMADYARISRPGLKVLFITGYAEQAVIGNGDLDADMHILTKPFSVESLAVRIKSLIEQN